MKKWFLLSLMFFWVLAKSQETEFRKYALTTVTDNAGISLLNILDTYISPLEYTGIGVYAQHAEQKLFSPDNTNLSMQWRLGALAGMTVNPKSTSSTAYLGGKISWGAYYNFEILEDLQLRSGAFVDGGAAIKQNARNVNNPYNFDFNTNLNLSVVVNYDFQIREKPYRLNFEIETPALGVMFVPESGISYYELVVLNNFSNTFHLSSFHNKQGITVNCGVEIPFRHSTWQIGLGVNKLNYTANNLFFEQNELKLFVGWKYNLYRFGGTRNEIPNNFIRAYK